MTALLFTAEVRTNHLKIKPDISPLKVTLTAPKLAPSATQNFPKVEPAKFEVYMPANTSPKNILEKLLGITWQAKKQILLGDDKKKLTQQLDNNKALFKQAFGEKTEYTKSIYLLTKLIRLNKTEATKNFIDNYREFLLVKQKYQIYKKISFEQSNKDVLHEIKTKKYLIEKNTSELKQKPKLNYIEKAHLATNPSRLQSFIVFITKPAYSAKKLATIKLREKEREALLKSHETLTMELNNLNEASVIIKGKLNKVKVRHEQLFNYISEFKTAATQALTGKKPNTQDDASSVTIIVHNNLPSSPRLRTSL